MKENSFVTYIELMNEIETDPRKKLSDLWKRQVVTGCKHVKVLTGAKTWNEDRAHVLCYDVRCPSKPKISSEISIEVKV